MKAKLYKIEVSSKDAVAMAHGVHYPIKEIFIPEKGIIINEDMEEINVFRDSPGERIKVGYEHQGY